MTTEENIFRALLQRSNSRGEGGDYADPGPKAIAKDFANVAAQNCSRDEIVRLLVLLANPRVYTEEQTSNMNRDVASDVDAFHTAEMSLSGRTRRELGRPGGSADSELGLILHVQSKDANYEKFFDKETPTIELLLQKGVSATRTFGYDWHWRGETTNEFRGRSHCQFHKWPVQVRKAHDNFSKRMLEVVPMPFLVVHGACAKRAVQAFVKAGKMSKSLQVGSLLFELDYVETRLRRIILYLPHPTAGFHSDRESALTIGTQIDTGWNFMLWLTGRNYALRSFTDRFVRSRASAYYRCSPITHMWNYKQIERAEHRCLMLSEFSKPFLEWARKYLKQDLAALISSGSSLVNAVADKMRLKAEQTRRAMRAELHGCPANQATNSPTETRVANANNPLRRTPLQVADGSQGTIFDVDVIVISDDDDTSNKDATTADTSEVIEISDDDEEIMRDEMIVDLDPDEPVNTDDYEANLPHHSQVSLMADDDEIDGIDPLVREEEGVRSQRHHRHDTDEEDSEIEAERPFQSIHGMVIDQLEKGLFIIPRISPLKPLIMVVPPGPTAQIGFLQQPVTIFVYRTVVVLRVGEVEVHRIAIDLLLLTFHGCIWQPQIAFELHKRGDEEDDVKPPKPWRQTQREVLRSRLFCGSNWPFIDKKCSISDIQIRKDGVLEKSIYLRAYLLPPGQSHPDFAGTECEADDAGRRLAIWARYLTAKGVIEEWVKLGGPGNVMKLNSLVDLMDGKSKDWSATQPRRYLRKWENQRHFYTTKEKRGKNVKPYAGKVDKRRKPPKDNWIRYDPK
ncbi:hypothetical protein KVT40_001599 [Elsinoe batatas]|uniref:Uncharacterized protein n=1 Tax=Elsinoe batatas TaxID=2601811 RepID=A0A8K0L9H8_9PEZI|nr:hypothetical protein KVT40_001599 [Elsinoe batatas]